MQSRFSWVIESLFSLRFMCLHYLYSCNRARLQLWGGGSVSSAKFISGEISSAADWLRSNIGVSEKQGDIQKLFQNYSTGRYSSAGKHLKWSINLTRFIYGSQKVGDIGTHKILENIPLFCNVINFDYISVRGIRWPYFLSTQKAVSRVIWRSEHLKETGGQDQNFTNKKKKSSDSLGKLC